MAAHPVRKTEVFLDQAAKAGKVKAENADKPPLFIHVAAHYTVEGIIALFVHVNAGVAEGLKLSTGGKKRCPCFSSVQLLYDCRVQLLYEDELRFTELLC